MRIGIDACCWSNRRGFGRFTRELVTHMVTGFPGHRFQLVVDQWTAQAGGFPVGAELVVVPTRYQPTQAASADGARGPGDLFRMARTVARLRADVFFFPAVYSFFPMLRRTPTAVTFHDAIAENLPGQIFASRQARLFWNLKTWLARRQSDLIVTVSESARSQIAAAFGVPASGIAVINEGPCAEFRQVDDLALRVDIRQKYSLPEQAQLILYVGGISPHKNLQGLFHALVELRRTRSAGWHAVLVGDHTDDSFFGCYQELLALRSQLDLNGYLTFTGYVPNEDLVILYNSATLMVLPSFSEGFGLPMVEAMACGLPVAASRRGSLPEVLGGAGLLFEPDEPVGMAACLDRLLGDPQLRADFRQAGLRRVEQFSWRKAACATIELLEGLAGVRRKVS